VLAVGKRRASEGTGYGSMNRWSGRGGRPKEHPIVRRAQASRPEYHDETQRSLFLASTH
jgi:hypothetical protein